MLCHVRGRIYPSKAHLLFGHTKCSAGLANMLEYKFKSNFYYAVSMNETFARTLLWVPATSDFQRGTQYKLTLFWYPYFPPGVGQGGQAQSGTVNFPGLPGVN
jgi:hypothetical protein